MRVLAQAFLANDIAQTSWGFGHIKGRKISVTQERAIAPQMSLLSPGIVGLTGKLRTQLVHLSKRPDENVDLTGLKMKILAFGLLNPS